MQSVTKASIAYVATQVSYHLLQLHKMDQYVYTGSLCIDVYSNILLNGSHHGLGAVL